jgi:hypothetical protein
MTFFEKLCKIVPVFASDPGKVVSGGVIRGPAGPGFGSDKAGPRHPQLIHIIKYD